MYDDHYGLSGRPFQLTPDPRFWFDTATHRKAMAYLGYGLAQGEGFIVITGDVGAGKTTLVGHLMDTIDPTRLHVIKIVSTQIEADDLLRMVAGGLDVDSAGLTKAQLLVAIERGLHATARAGRRTLLIVDEAQALPVASLEELRMLSNFQTGGHALLQIFLLGQPEFRERLHGSERLEQLRQRVIAMHHLDPMEPEEVEPYMRHRLSVVGWQERPHFTPDAFAALYAGSDGVPRRLNQLAGRVMLFGAIEQIDTIDAQAVAAVIADIAGDMPGGTPVAMPEAVMVPAAQAPAPVIVAPLPISNTPPPADPRPIRVIRDEPTPQSEPEREAVPAPEPTPELDLAARIAALEARVDEQDVALRRVLKLLVDWAEGDRSVVPTPRARQD
ncbi:MAG: AAA family ATPase [Sphingomonas sp.]|jgi:putative secretion ATPase (PEP-CTERM system associated)|uniref:ExeA family protein n=1 Tax=Sphingomonas sp. TaxID=28214 RepID=UPI003568CE97